MLAYLALGVLLVAVLHLAARKEVFARFKPKDPAKVAKWLTLGGFGAVLLVALRIGCGPIVSLLSACAAIYPAFHRLRQSIRANRGAAGPQQAQHTTMSEAEARELLGVSPQATPKEIRAAHKKLIQTLHPDRGGNVYLAARVNLARDVLLKKKG